MAQFSDVQHGKQRYYRKTELEDKGSYIPSPEEIQAGCLRAQAKWSDYERAERCVYPIDPVTITRSYESNLGQSGTCRRRYSVERDR